MTVVIGLLRGAGVYGWAWIAWQKYKDHHGAQFNEARHVYRRFASEATPATQARQ